MKYIKQKQGRKLPISAAFFPVIYLMFIMDKYNRHYPKVYNRHYPKLS